MKKTIAFVLAFAMAFATAFSAVGKGVTASAADKLTLKVSAAIADGKIIFTPTVDEELTKPVTYTYGTAADALGNMSLTDGSLSIGLPSGPTTYYFKATPDAADAGYSESDVVSVYYPGVLTIALETSGEFKATNVNKELQVGIATVKKGVATIKNWDTYEAKTARYNTADDSFVGYDMTTPALDPASQYEVEEATGFITFTPKKDMYLAFRTVGINGDSYGEPVFWEVQKNSAKYKAKIAINTNTDTAQIKVNDNNITSTTYAVYSNVLGNNSVDASGVIDEQLYNIGATLQVTPKGQAVTQPNTSKVTYLGETYDIENVIQADAKTVNVKLKKRANAPAVKINYVKGTVTVPKSTKYRIIKSANDWSGEYTNNSDKKTVDLDGNFGLVQVYKSATEKALGSKIGTATYGQNTSVEESDYSVTYADGNDLVIESKTDDVLEYFIGTAAPTASAKWTKIKGKGKATIKAAKVDKTATAYVRRAANAKKFAIAGNYTSIDYVSIANSAKTQVEVKSSAYEADKKSIKIVLSSRITGTATATLKKDAGGTEKVSVSVNGDTVILATEDGSVLDGSALDVTLELSAESAKTLKFVDSNNKAVTSTVVSIPVAS